MHDMTPKRFAKAKQETTRPALELTARLYNALINMKPFTLLDGTPVSVKAYQPPQINDQGEAECGVDIVLPDGHLEFMLRNTGWGKSFAKEIAAKRIKRTRDR
jgi:hypothetical protein